MAALRVVGVPSSAGAYCVGVERAPAALRAAGLMHELAAGGAVRDLGDLTERRWRPDRASRFAQNVDDEAASLRELAEIASEALASGDQLLVLGGSCTVAVGLCAALARTEDRARLVYIDRHLDLNTPDTTVEGSLSWMGMAHALGLSGSADAVSRLEGAEPVLLPSHLSYLGVQMSATTGSERERVRDQKIPVIEQKRLVEDPAGAAAEARAALPAGPFGVHLDVDVLDFLDAPLAENVNGRNTGPTIEQLGVVLADLWRRPDCRALSIGQLDPGHAEADPDALDRLVRMLSVALRAR